MKGSDRINTVAQTPSASIPGPQRDRFVGWSAIASGLSLIIVGQKPYFPPSLRLVLLLGTVVLYLGMIPIARWTANSLAMSERGEEARVARVARIIGVTGASVAAATALLAPPHWLPAVSAQILDTSSLGVIGVWLLVANVLAIRVQLYNRVLAVLGVLAGIGWLLIALLMWAELTVITAGSLVSTLENLRVYGGYLAQFFYLIWALWLGVWLLVRQR